MRASAGRCRAVACASPRRLLPDPRPAMRRTVAVILVLLAVVGFPAPARAGGGLVSASPSDGAALAVAPAAIELTFTTPPDPGASHVAVWDAAHTSLVT